MQIEADMWFPTTIWRTKLSIDNESIKKGIYELKNQSSGRQYSNYGGWQSQDIQPVDWMYPLVDQLIPLVKNISESVNLPSLKLMNIWANVNPTGTYNLRHKHPDAIISGVYYVDIPDERAGDITFYRDDESFYYLHKHVDISKKHFFTGQTCTYETESGKLLLFPSWVDHEVQGNRSDKDRISISFNFGVFDET